MGASVPQPKPQPLRSILAAPPTRAGPPGLEPGTANLSRLALLAQLVEHLHGKEGVDGSSPSEGFAYCLLSSLLCCLFRRRRRGSASTKRPPAGRPRARRHA